MQVKVYGKLDADSRLYDAIVAFADKMEGVQLVIAAYQRKPLNARPCQGPGSLFYEFNLDGKVYGAKQKADGKVICPM